MKCVCGYENEGNEAFVKLIVRTMEVWKDNTGEFFENDVFRHDVYACPECGTLKIEVKE